MKVECERERMLAGWPWAFGGKRGGAAEQGRAGLDWTGLDRVGGCVDGWVGRSSVLGRWAADRVGCKGGYGGTRGGQAGHPLTK